MAVIEFENVCKAYRIGSGRGSLREAIPELFGRLVGQSRRNGSQLLWALEKVSFEVERGDSLGIVGPNGAGKTTVLKLLSRVTKPTEGRVLVNGRPSALIELGAGFHPDLTGRENVYLNGLILGLKQQEIGRKFESIVEFAGLPRFIDTPVKRYSSGMYVRLAFAVAIHVEPQVLLIDEVLSVGDHQFQRKCHAAMRRILGQTTVVFVSHNLAAVNSVCQRAIWLEAGQIRCEGPVTSVTEAYANVGTDSATPSPSGSGLGRQWGNHEARIANVRILNGAGDEAEVIESGARVGVEIDYEASRRIESPYFGLGVFDSSGMKLYGEHTGYGPYCVSEIEGKGQVCCWIDSLPLPAGDYYLTVTIEPAITGARDPFDYHDKAYMLHVKHTRNVWKEGLLALSTHWTHMRG